MLSMLSEDKVSIDSTTVWAGVEAVKRRASARPEPVARVRLPGKIVRRGMCSCRIALNSARKTAAGRWWPTSGLKLGENDVSSLVEGSQILGFKRPTDETTIGESVAKHDAWRVLFFQNRTPLRAGREEGCAGAKEQLGSMAIAAQHLRQRLRWEWSAWVRCHGRQVPRRRK